MSLKYERIYETYAHCNKSGTFARFFIYLETLKLNSKIILHVTWVLIFFRTFVLKNFFASVSIRVTLEMRAETHVNF
jgi:hypothetical protein